jgi:hypothetical protein
MTYSIMTLDIMTLGRQHKEVGLLNMEVRLKQSNKVIPKITSL